MQGSLSIASLAVTFALLFPAPTISSAVRGAKANSNSTLFMNWTRSFDSLNQKEGMISNGFVDINRQVLTEMLGNLAFPTYLETFLQILSKAEDFEAQMLELLDTVKNKNCKAHVTEWIHRALTKPLSELQTEKQKWVLQFADSWGKRPEGLLSGHVNAFGDYNGCINIHVNSLQTENSIYPNTSTAFNSRYCTVTMVDYKTSMYSSQATRFVSGKKDKISTHKHITRRSVSLEKLTELINRRKETVITPSLGVCFPNSCAKEDIHQILVNAVALLYTDSKSDTRYPTQYPWPLATDCYENTKIAVSSLNICIMSIVFGIALLCVVVGISDYCFYHGVDKEFTFKLKVLFAFSLFQNLQLFLRRKKTTRDNINCLHGIRVLSTAWVVLGHTYFIAGWHLPQWNMIERKTFHNSPSFLTVLNSSFAVDTFFVMSGLLVSINTLKFLDKTRGKLNLALFYISRYLRLTPAYAIVLAITSIIFPYLGSGPTWAVMESWTKTCGSTWWYNLLYVNNIFQAGLECHGESWYLASDMQFYVLTPFILYPIWKWKRYGISLLSLCTFVSVLLPAFLVYSYETVPTLLSTRDIKNHYTLLYILPHTRVQPYLVGIWLGWILYKSKDMTIQLPKFLAPTLWTFSTSMALCVLYSIYEWFDPNVEIPQIPGLLYAGLSRISWGISISWVIFACYKGYGGPVNRLLSWSVFEPLGRICFCVYLVSLHLQLALHAQFKQPMYMDSITEISFFFADLFISFLVGFFLHLMFEAPFANICGLLFASSKTKAVKMGPNNKA